MKHGGKIVEEQDNDKDCLIVADESYQSVYGVNSKQVISASWISSSIEKGESLSLTDFTIDDNKMESASSIQGESPKRKNKSNSFELPQDFKNTFYACQRKTPLISKNEELLALLEQIERHRYLTGNDRSALSYRRAISAIKAYPKPIESSLEAAAITGVGEKMSNLVGEFLSTGKIREAEQVSHDEDVQIIGDLVRVHGIGPKVAAKLKDQGICNVEELRNAVKEGTVKMTDEQSLGLQYMEDFESPMSRECVQQIANDIKNFLKESSLTECRVDIVGGYRRGKEKSGDADILISPLEQEFCTGILQTLVGRLKSSNRIVDILSYHEGHEFKKTVKSAGKKKQVETTDHLDKCLCVYRLPDDPIAHRLDIIVSPKSQFAFALLGWTGSRQFERSIRHYAEKEHGCKLSSHDLVDRKTGMSFPAASEQDIFKLLHLEYIEPEFRNC